jgi:predicted transcriptional regulator
MAKKYNMSQVGIADTLNTTQAAVSKYLSGKYSARVKKVENGFRKDEVEEFVRHAISESRYGAQKTVCRMCSRNLSFKCALMVK